MSAKGGCPFKSFLEGTRPKVTAKFIKRLDLLRYQGPNLKRPYADSLRDGIRELRVRIWRGRYRALYFFTRGRYIIITHGILKTTSRVPPEEIDRALRCKKDFEARLSRGEVEL